MLRTTLILAAASGVAAHGHMTKPRPRPSLWAPGKEQGATSADATYRYDQPTHTLGGGMTHESHTYTDTSFRCHDFASSAPATTITAGAALELEWSLPAAHPGDCSLYISYDADTVAPARWVKLHNFVGCVSKSDLPSFTGPAPNNQNAYEITLPTWLPSSDHAVLRWEWYSVQQVTDIEFYTTCADVTVVGTGDSVDTFYGKAQPVVTVSGTSHLPTTADAYRKAYDGQVGAEYLVGPTVATYDGVPADGGGEDAGGGGGGGDAGGEAPVADGPAPLTPVEISPVGAGFLGAAIGAAVGAAVTAALMCYCFKRSAPPPPPPPPKTLNVTVQ